MRAVTSFLALDPDLEKFLELVRQAGRPPFEALTPEQARVAYAAGWDALQLPVDDIGSVRDVTIPGPGGTLTLRIYRGVGTRDDELLPGLVYLHGGGWVVGELDDYDSMARTLAKRSNCALLMPDYRLAPEHPFPAALEDAQDAILWASQRIGELAGSPLPFLVGGDSAGGNLATVALLELGQRVATAAQLLIYPVADYHTPGTPSYLERATGNG